MEQMEQSAFGQQEGGKLVDEDFFIYFFFPVFVFYETNGGFCGVDVLLTVFRFEALTDSSSICSNTPPRCQQMRQDGSFNLS